MKKEELVGIINELNTWTDPCTRLTSLGYGCRGCDAYSPLPADRPEFPHEADCSWVAIQALIDEAQSDA